MATCKYKNVFISPGAGGAGVSHVKRTGVLVIPFGIKKNAVLVPLRVFSLKTSAAEAFAVLFRVLSRNKYDRR